MSDTETNNDDIEKRILDASVELFIHYGYDKTTVNDIADKAGVSKSTIYTRWKKKEDIFDTLVWRESKVYAEEWMENVKVDPRGGVYSVWMKHALAGFFRNEFLRTLYKRDRKILGSMLQSRGIEQMFLQRQMAFNHLFKSLQAVGAVRKDVDSHSLTYLMNAVQYGLIQMADIIPDEHTPALDKVLEMMFDMVDHTVTPEDGGNHEAGKAILLQFMEQVQKTLDNFENKT